MNQRDFKEIAGIIKRRYKKWKYAEVAGVARDLADYFEREQKYKCLTCGAYLDSEAKQRHTDHTKHIDWKADFNKQQFLKDAGVK